MLSARGLEVALCSRATVSMIGTAGDTARFPQLSELEPVVHTAKVTISRHDGHEQRGSCGP